MRKILFTAFISIFSLIAMTASAHVLKVDSTIGAVLHVDPNDSPAAGELASIFFDFKDSAGKFDVEKCDCVLRVKKGEEVTFERKLASMAATAYAFPERGIYIISLTGAPKDGGQFNSFELAYDIRVETVAENPAMPVSQNFFGRHLIHIILFGGAIVFAIIVMARDTLRRKSQKSTE